MARSCPGPPQGSSRDADQSAAVAARRQQDEVVAVDDLALVRRPELAPQAADVLPTSAGISSASKLTRPRATGVPSGPTRSTGSPGDERAGRTR